VKISMVTIVPVILAGGSGSRLWPLSREHYPKQLLSLVGQHSLLQETIKRSEHISHIKNPLVICNKEYRFLIAEQMLAIGIQHPQLILESMGRNTAPAIAMAALIAQKLYPNDDPLLLILPADHILEEPKIFAEYLEAMVPFAEQGQLATFGITPTYPETGYGYIEAGPVLAKNIYKITKFIEKPSLPKAEQYLKAGSYYWNSGMFLFKSESYLQELKKHRPQILKACQQEAQHLTEIGGFYHLSENFNNCPSESIDYAVMEHTDKALITPLPVKWSDVGSWSALLDILPKDKEGNIIQGDVTAIDVQNCYIRSEGRLVAIAGLKDHIVIETPDAVMIAHKDYAQNVKDLFNHLKANARDEVKHHSVVQRPWGSYEILTQGPFYRVKHVLVKPGAQLSSQAHKHRSEHWIVLKGTANITLDGQQKTLRTYESTFIPINHMHQLSNQSSEPLEIIEVQAGDYLSEEDIYHEDD
jgi:mannose-1-phosphate guanylyltransferase